MNKFQTNILGIVVSIGSLLSAGSVDAFQGGKPVPQKLAGFASFLIVSNESATQAICSGTRIAPHYFLTAAHCLSHTDRTQASIISFITRSDDEYLFTMIEEVYSHPDYPHNNKDTSTRKESSTDIAIFKTKDDFPSLGTGRLDLTHKHNRNNQYLTLGTPNTIKAGQNHQQQFNYGIHKLSFFTNASRNAGFLIIPGKNGVPTQGDSGGPLYTFNPRTQQYDTVVGVTTAVSEWFIKNQGVRSLYVAIGNKNQSVQRFLQKTIREQKISVSR